MTGSSAMSHRRVYTLLARILFFLVLTLLTQIGGLMVELSLWICHKLSISSLWKRVGLTLGVYLLATFLIVPKFASLLGRERVIHTDCIQPTNYMTVILNRNYVTPELNHLLALASRDLEGSTIEIRYLDANFPFMNGFPLLPHLSHNDGNKIDISLVYEDTKGKLVNAKKSISGYGVFEGPFLHEHDQNRICQDRGFIQYDFPKYLTFGRINAELQFSSDGTKQLINAFLRHSILGKLFIEPHLKNRLGLKDPRIRFHGCQAVRHDDHIHIQL